MSDIKQRVKRLEAKTPDGENMIVIDWGDDRLFVGGVYLTRVEFDKLYPDAISIEWGDNYPDQDEAKK